MDETKRCKCCGDDLPISDFDRSNNGSPISLCKRCRRAQQKIANLSNMPDELMTLSRQQQLAEATQWMDACKKRTGFVTGTTTRGCGNRVEGINVGKPITSHKMLENMYAEAQARRKRAETMGVPPLQPPTLEMLRNSELELLIEYGYTAKECTDVIDAEVDHDSDEYCRLDDKFFAYPR